MKSDHPLKLKLKKLQTYTHYKFSSNRCLQIVYMKIWEGIGYAKNT